MHPGQDPSLPPVNLPTIPSACILPFPPGHATPLPNLRPPEFHTNIPLQVPTGPPREFQPGNPEVPPEQPGGPPGQYPNPIPGGQGGHATPLPNLRPSESYTSIPLQVPPGEVPPGNPALPPGVLPGKPVVPPGLLQENIPIPLFLEDKEVSRTQLYQLNLRLNQEK